ncbi:heterodisulfide reductase-related iron-sulfur binding cluster [Oceanibacterium hippocampi]|uniref:Anaerobic glycerol-3-phosphate dehydrogenase subunit C n=1 Tax=Oceanibacterium hippocampi TaxID=745714 RepID=A0A1Y5RKR1_9PROT|nr:heterodisulfide reductase-related iron-sulfur binding cluster [Oceanibacterium hippocampi]SLN18817.1 Anaerobic glycerol-3-phosphate dehydrogenase subunit C [Oceanibacterium hippocampi]
MREGSLDAPVRHPLDWQNPDFYDAEKIDAELRRVFDICHGCRRCFNLCDSFPRLFDLIDDSDSGELDSVSSEGFKPVVDACTLCDMCFMTKCPYVPPHEFNLDFPHLMLRYRAAEARAGKISFVDRQLTETDRNGKLAGAVAPLANWATGTGNRLTRPLLEKVADIHRDAHLPEFHGKTFKARAEAQAIEVDRTAPAAGRKAVLYATCFANYNSPSIGEAARQVLARNGVETVVEYPGCCGMPQLEHGELDRVAESARTVAAALERYIDEGYDIVALVPSCALMLKFEWPLILPDDPLVAKLAKASFDITEFVVDIAKRQGLADGLKPLDGGVALHFACHARAQNMGPKAQEMLKLIPETEVTLVERCSGHGGSWGIKKENFEVALKIGKPAARNIAKATKAHVASECPLAGAHLVQALERLGDDVKAPAAASHPIELLARAYGY